MSGLTLAAGLVTTLSTGFAGRSAGDRALTVAGLVVLLGAWLAVVHAATRD